MIASRAFLHHIYIFTTQGPSLPKNFYYLHFDDVTMFTQP